MDVISEIGSTEVAEAQPARSSSGGRLWALELLHTLLLPLVIFLGARGMVQRYQVEGISMEPTLRHGEHLWVNKIAYLHVDQGSLRYLLPGTMQGSVKFVFGGPRRGDIAVFRPPREGQRDFVKRIIGLPGDTVLIRSGRVYVNGEPIDEPYIRFNGRYNYPINGVPTVVPDGHYFVLGDNRPNSSDSHFGWFVPADNLVGRVWQLELPPLLHLAEIAQGW